MQTQVQLCDREYQFDQNDLTLFLVLLSLHHPFFTVINAGTRLASIYECRNGWVKKHHRGIIPWMIEKILLSPFTEQVFSFGDPQGPCGDLLNHHVRDQGEQECQQQHRKRERGNKYEHCIDRARQL